MDHLHSSDDADSDSSSDGDILQSHIPRPLKRGSESYPYSISNDFIEAPSMYAGTYTSPPFIGIAGIIGAGKTTLCLELVARLGYLYSGEPVETNPYLPLFYADMDAYSYRMQMYMLGQRFKEHQRCVWSGKPIIQDRTIYEDVIFALMLHAQGRMSRLDYDTYRSIYESMLHFLHRPDVIIYLDVTPETAKERIAHRGRACEADIGIDYLSDLRKYYRDWLNTGVRGIPILHLDWNAPSPSAVNDIVTYLSKVSRQVTMPCVTYIGTTPGTVNQ